MHRKTSPQAKTNTLVSIVNPATIYLENLRPVWSSLLPPTSSVLGFVGWLRIDLAVAEMGCASSKPKKKKHHFGTNLVVERNKSVESDYKIIKRIGKGSIGIIYLAESRRPTFFDTPGTTSGNAAAGLDASWATRSFHNNNNNSDVLGRSTTSKNSDGKRQYAIKEIDTKMIDVRAIESLKTEIRILKNLDHPFIIKIFGSYTSVTKDREKLSVVMELCTGGTLDMYVPFKESVAKVLVANIVEAVLYLHNQNVIHRDLKVRSNN